MKKGQEIPTNQQSVEYLKAADEAKDNTRIARYIFLLLTGFLGCLFITYFFPRQGDAEPLLSSNLVHFIAGSLFTALAVIVDRYFKTGAQKGVEKDLTYLVGKLKQEDSQVQTKETQ